MESKAKLFKAAWAAARRGADTFGGSPREYFRLALVYAWEAAKAPKPARPDWSEGRTLESLTAEQRDRIAVQTQAHLADLLARTKAAGLARGRSNHQGAWIGR